MPSPLSVNNLIMPPDFPDSAFERVFSRVKLHAANHMFYDDFAGAWNAISLRFLTLCAKGDSFAAAIGAPDSGSSFEQRYNQE
jgi:hypothetical protein